MPVRHFSFAKASKFAMGGALLAALLAACDSGSPYEENVAPFGDWKCLMGNFDEATLLEITMNEDFSFEQLMRATTEDRVLLIKSSGEWLWKENDLTFNLEDVNVEILLTRDGKAKLIEQGESVEGVIEEINEFFATQEQAKSQDLTIAEMRDDLMVLDDRGSMLNCTR